MGKIFKLIIALAVIAIIVGVAVTLINDTDDRYKSEVNFTINDTLPDGEGKHATVILLGGQSNASGCSRDDYLRKNVGEEEYARLANGFDNVYINYYATGTNMSDGFVRAGVMQGEAGGYFGPELGIADRLNAIYPDETFFIIKCAWGGTNLYEQWLSPSSYGDTGYLYAQFVEFVNGSLEYLTEKNYNVTIAGMCWMQGESDSFTVTNSIFYRWRLANFISDIRKEFKDYADEDGIAFIDAYIADLPTVWLHYKLVNYSKSAVAGRSELNAVIDTVSVGLTTAEEPEDAPDIAHYDAMSQLKLGHLFAEEMAKFIG